MEVLRLASCMAENTEGFCRALAAHIHDQLGVEVKYVDDKPWQERESLLTRETYKFYGSAVCLTLIRSNHPIAVSSYSRFRYSTGRYTGGDPSIFPMLL